MNKELRKHWPSEGSL